MVTAAREAETVRAAAAGGAARYLVKPFGHEDLLERLEAFRAAHDALRGVEAADQREIDAVFARAPARAIRCLRGSPRRPPTRSWPCWGRRASCRPA